MKNVLLFGLCMSLCSCSLFSEKITIREEKPKLNLSNPEPLNLNPIKFKVIHQDNCSQYFEDVKSQPNKSTVFALTETDYSNLAINMEKIKSYIKRQKKIIELYQNYYEGKPNVKSLKAKDNQKVEKY